MLIQKAKHIYGFKSSKRTGEPKIEKQRSPFSTSIGQHEIYMYVDVYIYIYRHDIKKENTGRIRSSALFKTKTRPTK